jgi:RHS repeat-associated protein
MGDLYPDYYSSFVSYSDGSAYAYNANGAMTSDPDKGARYAYNLFGMPSQVKVPAILGTIDYKYSATGERLEVSYKWHSGLSLDPQENVNRPTYTATNSSRLRQYAGNKVYENGSLKRILLDNGYIEGGIYYFYLRDHLGNNSVVAKANGQVVQRNHYYPYGKVIGNGESWGQVAQPYKFGGKEEETMFGLELYDFHARQMDRRIPGFLTVDPLAEKYYSWSPYVYCAGNPINNVDPSGEDYWITNDPVQIRAFLNSVGNGNSQFDFSKNWTHLTDAEFASSLSYNDESGKYYMSYGTVENGEVVINSKSFDANVTPVSFDGSGYPGAYVYQYGGNSNWYYYSYANLKDFAFGIDYIAPFDPSVYGSWSVNSSGRITGKI